MPALHELALSRGDDAGATTGHAGTLDLLADGHSLADEVDECGVDLIDPKTAGGHGVGVGLGHGALRVKWGGPGRSSTRVRGLGCVGEASGSSHGDRSPVAVGKSLPAHDPQASRWQPRSPPDCATSTPWHPK